MMSRVYHMRTFQLVTISLDDSDKRDDATKVLKEKVSDPANHPGRGPPLDGFAGRLDRERPSPGPLHHIDRAWQHLYERAGS